MWVLCVWGGGGGGGNCTAKGVHRKVSCDFHAAFGSHKLCHLSRMNFAWASEIRHTVVFKGF